MKFEQQIRVTESLTLARTWGGGGLSPPGVVFFLAGPHTASDRAEFLHSCISNFSPDILKISSLYDLWLVRYDLVLQVMSGRILHSLTSRPRHSFDPNTLKPALCNTGIGL